MDTGKVIEGRFKVVGEVDSAPPRAWWQGWSIGYDVRVLIPTAIIAAGLLARLGG